MARVMASLLKGGIPQALLVSSAPLTVRSHDSHYPYRQSSDFYYLTGTTARDLALLVTTGHKRPLLFGLKPDAKKIVWEGPGPDLEKIAAAIGAEPLVVDSIEREVLPYLKNIERLYHQNTPDSISWNVARRLIQTPPFQRMRSPKEFSHSDSILEEMRLYKDAEEIKLIEQAAVFTNNSLFDTMTFVREGRKEFEIAATLDYFFRLHGCEVAFSTIVGGGKSAATLHHEDLSNNLKKGEMLLIDCGAEYKMYAADITRVVPIGGKFSTSQRVLYQCVLDAQLAAIRKVKHGVKIETIYNAAAEVMIEGLRELKVLKGNTAQLIKQKAWKPYFPHGIGHSLGMDVHDVGGLRGNNEAQLEEGMVMTIEPGLYFAKAVGMLKPCGVRIEDDVLVTKTGSKILSAGFPKDIDEIEELFS